MYTYHNDNSDNITSIQGQDGLHRNKYELDTKRWREDEINKVMVPTIDS